MANLQLEVNKRYTNRDGEERDIILSIPGRAAGGILYLDQHQVVYYSDGVVFDMNSTASDLYKEVPFPSERYGCNQSGVGLETVSSKVDRAADESKYSSEPANSTTESTGISLERGRKYWTKGGEVIEVVAVKRPAGASNPIYVGSNHLYYNREGVTAFKTKQSDDLNDIILLYREPQIIKVVDLPRVSLEAGKSYHTATGKLIHIVETFCVGNTAQNLDGSPRYDDHNWPVYKGANGFLYTVHGVCLERESKYGRTIEREEDLVYEYGTLLNPI